MPSRAFADQTSFATFAYSWRDIRVFADGPSRIRGRAFAYSRTGLRVFADGPSRLRGRAFALKNILTSFNAQFGTQFTDGDRIIRRVTEAIAPRVARDPAYQNAQQNSDPQNARIEHDKALGRIIISMMRDDTTRFKQFMDNESFKHWLTDTVFRLTYAPHHPATEHVPPALNIPPRFIALRHKVWYS